MRTARLVDLLEFDRLITPVVVRTVYWIGNGLLVAASVVGLGLSLATLSWGGVAFAVLGGGFGFVFWRVFCELVVIPFRIHDELRALRTKTASEADATEAR